MTAEQNTQVLPAPDTAPPELSARGIARIRETACAPAFRGDIVENCRRFRFVGDGYKAMPPEQDGHFQIETARQIAGPLAALMDSLVRIVHVIGATQVLKSMVGDAWVVYCFEHLLLPMLVLFEDEDKAGLFTSLRLMDTLKAHPEISRLIAESKHENRHQVTGTWIKVAGTQLLVAGMNEGNVSTISWPLVWVSEAWQHKKDGLLFKAFKRTDRFPDTFKILNESQASLAGMDLHTATKGAHQVPLEWRCPACDGWQSWEWHHWSHKRPDDFVPRPRKKLNLVRIGGQLALLEDAPPKPGSYAGMRWTAKSHGALDGDDSEDTRTIEEKSASAYWECIWCGHRIQDTRAERRALCDTYRQEYRVLAAPANGGQAQQRTPREVCFTIPFESAYDNFFRKTVANFLAAKAAKRLGNATPLQDWFMAERAVFYDPRLEQRESVISVGSYDPNELIPNELCRNMAVDVQEDKDHKERTGASIPGWFWFIVRIYDKLGNSKQLARGYAKSWADWIAVQKRWGVPNDRVVIDIDHWPTEIMQKAAEHRELVKIAKPVPPFYLTQKTTTWYLFAAENKDLNFKHADKQTRPWSPEQRLPVALFDEKGNRTGTVQLKKIRYTKKVIQQQLDAVRSGAPGMPKFEVLGRDQLKLPDGAPDQLTLTMEKDDRTYSRQMDAQYFVPEENKFKELRPDDHYRWCEEALLLRGALDGLFGHVGVFH